MSKLKPLLPCPFCGTDFVEVSFFGPYFVVRCRRFACGVMGPQRHRQATAIAAWNRRPKVAKEGK